MVTTSILKMLADFINWWMDMIPESLAPPEWAETSGYAVAELFSTVHSLGVWIPTDLAFLVAAFLIQAYIGGGLVKAGRILISHFTGGGGSAA